MSDGTIAQALSEPNTQEALAWLQGPRNVLRTITGGNGKGWKAKRAEDLVKRLYRHGAVSVLAVGVRRIQADWIVQYASDLGHSGVNVLEDTAMLIVELPTDPAARVEIFRQWVATFGRNKWDVPKDTGQKHLMFWWD